METTIIYFFGGLISLLLSLNAFFGRRTLEKLTDVEMKLAVLIQKHDATEERARQNTKEIERLREQLGLSDKSLRERLHKLEGGQVQLIAWLEDLKEYNHN